MQLKEKDILNESICKEYGDEENDGLKPTDVSDRKYS
jgi:hypothetical protein